MVMVMVLVMVLVKQERCSEKEGRLLVLVPLLHRPQLRLELLDDCATVRSIETAVEDAVFSRSKGDRSIDENRQGCREGGADADHPHNAKLAYALGYTSDERVVGGRLVQDCGDVYQGVPREAESGLNKPHNKKILGTCGPLFGPNWHRYRLNTISLEKGRFP